MFFDDCRLFNFWDLWMNSMIFALHYVQETMDVGMDMIDGIDMNIELSHSEMSLVSLTHD